VLVDHKLITVFLEDNKSFLYISEFICSQAIRRAFILRISLSSTGLLFFFRFTLPTAIKIL